MLFYCLFMISAWSDFDVTSCIHIQGYLCSAFHNNYHSKAALQKAAHCYNITVKGVWVVYGLDCICSWVDEWMDGWTDGWIERWIDEWMDKKKERRMYG